LLPVILLLYATPQVTILPLFILYFGIVPASKVTYGVSHRIFPIMITTIASVQNLKPILLICARSMGASRPDLPLGYLPPHDHEVLHRHCY
jgi:ABC-type nitrate/sulfonate/bicarbonate transport system permease component